MPEEISAEVLKIADEEVEKALGKEWEERAIVLSKATKKFLQNIKDDYEDIDKFNQLQSNVHKLKQTLESIGNSDINADSEKKIAEINAAIKEYQNNNFTQEKFLRFLSHVDTYNRALNGFFNQEIRTVYVHRTRKGEVVLYDVTGNIDENVRYRLGSRGRGAGAMYQRGKNYKEHIMENTIGIQQLQETYNISYQRAKNTQNQLRQIKNNDSSVEWKAGLYVYWKVGKKWDKMYVATLGDLAEAYAYFALEEKRRRYFAIQADIEKRIRHFMKEGVAQVDSVSGLFWSDVEGAGQQYAIKAAGASIAGYRQTVSLANTLENQSPKNIAKVMLNEWNKIQQQQQEKKGRRNKMLDKTIDQEINDILNDFIKSTENMKK